MEIMQPCSLAKLVSAILDVPLEKSYKAAGLLCCPVCEKPSTKPEYYPYCGLPHQRKGIRKDTGLGLGGAIYVDMMCDGCGIDFKRKASVIMQYARRRDRQNLTGEYKTFCGKYCTGHDLGSKTHPTIPLGGTHARRFNHDAIWARHLETGDGARKLARHFEMSVSHAKTILRKARHEPK